MTAELRQLPCTAASRAAYRALRAEGMPGGAAEDLALRVLERTPRNHLAVVHAFAGLLGRDLTETYSFLLRGKVLPTPSCAGCRRAFGPGELFRFHLSDRGTLALCEPYCRDGRPPSKIPTPELPGPTPPRSAG